METVRVEETKRPDGNVYKIHIRDDGSIRIYNGNCQKPIGGRFPEGDVFSFGFTYPQDIKNILKSVVID